MTLQRRIIRRFPAVLGMVLFEEILLRVINVCDLLTLQHMRV